MFKVIVSPEAWEEFFEIFDFIAVSDRAVAASFCDGILDHIDLLSRFPHEARQGVEVIPIWHTARQKPLDV